jgi:hypothetical protein
MAAAPSFSGQQSKRWNGSAIQRDAWYSASVSGWPYRIARGLRWAWAKLVSAISASVSWVMPCSCMKRIVCTAQIWAGVTSP